MTKTKTKPAIVEVDRRSGAYEMIQERAIIDHPKYGRILISEAWGGMDDIRGGAYRYSDGFACQLKPSDTFDVLRAEEEKYGGPLDEIRDRLEWSGMIIYKVAKSVGL